jgi:hypothetical protein
MPRTSVRPFRKRNVISIISACLILAVAAPAQIRNRIAQNIGDTEPVVVSSRHPLARAEFDQGRVEGGMQITHASIVFKLSAAQQGDLDQLLAEQQDPHSSNYHKWLTPEQYGQQFGPTDSDLQTITAWLQSHGFEVGSTKGRTVLEFSGTAGQVREAFHTTIHKYIVNGEQHWANANDPLIPNALTPAVAGVLTLHNFIKKPAIHFTGEAIPAKLVQGKSRPQVTFPPQGGQAAINALAPQDYAVIDNITPLYNVNITGGATIGVVGRSNLYNSGQDVQDFFEQIGYGNNTFTGTTMQVILNGPDPGDLGGGEEAEATLDSTWTGAIAPSARVNLVVSATTNTTDGIDLSEAYIIENNFADVMTESFSACELYATDAQLASVTTLAFTVNPEPSTTTLSVVTADQNGNSIPFTSGPFGSFVYLRGDVAGQSGYGVPTGTVTFTDSFAAIPAGGTFALNGQGNTANPNGVFNFDTGTHTISASYSGDPSFNPSNSTQSQTFTITPGFYGAISAAQSTVSISAPGSSGTTSISVSNSTGFKGTITLACSGLPSEAACLFAPATITPNGTPTTTSASITVTTTAATTSSQQRAYLPGQWMAGIGLLLGSTVLLGGKPQRVRGLFLMLMLVLLVAPGCGGGSSSSGGGGGGGGSNPPPNAGTPVGTSTILVTATSGSTVSTSAFTLMVQ